MNRGLGDIRQRLLRMVTVAAIAGCGGATEAPSRGTKPAQTKAQNPAQGRLQIDVDRGLREAREALTARQPSKAITLLYPLIGEAPDNIDVRVVLATAYSGIGEHQKALTQAQEALRRAPRSKGALLAKASALAATGKIQTGIETLRVLLRLEPTHAGAWLNISQFYGLTRQWSQQEVALSKLIALSPDVPSHRVDRARALIRLGRTEQARKVLEDALLRVPHDPEGQLLLSAVLYEQGELEAAMDRADIAARLAPERTAAFELFRASFYVAVASRLECRHGAAPWPQPAIDKVLTEFRRQGIDDVEEFYVIHKSYGASREARERITQQARRCRDAAASPGASQPPKSVAP